jgi:hypothetical protein
VWVWNVERGDEFVCRASNLTPSGYLAWRSACYHNGISIVFCDSDSLAIEILSFTVSNKTITLGSAKPLIHLDPDVPIFGLILKSELENLAFSISGQYMAVVTFSSDPRRSVIIVYNVADQTFQE